MKLSSTFAALAQKMALDFDTLAKEIEHRGEAGTAREQALRKLLEQYLPKRAAISTGFVIDGSGGESRQMDRRAEEAEWRAKSGPVINYIDPEITKKNESH
jgi:hypothetical protein